MQRGVRFRLEGEDWLFLRTWHDGFKDFGPETLFNLTQDPHETTDLAPARADVVAHASKLLADWWAEQAALSDHDVDPLMTVLREGGPYHTRGELPGYLDWLEQTGRGDAAAKLRARHPEKTKGEATLR
ncbi:hypothetical protein QWZ10_22440 [Paracoccus cavernae]|uniref:Sulfatase N-terminal domain-containing protein n=1 Tax=Paracoccus cavernae TaxID=1571207 RepID=A0ABT8DDF9_9RHOB|nr:hypothetical protein [Paracoccus cavernae]